MRRTIQTKLILCSEREEKRVLTKTPVGQIPKECEGNFPEDHIGEYPEFLRKAVYLIGISGIPL
jgi:hypothetical protein